MAGGRDDNGGLGQRVLGRVCRCGLGRVGVCCTSVGGGIINLGFALGVDRIGVWIVDWDLVLVWVVI